MESVPLISEKWSPKSSAPAIRDDWYLVPSLISGLNG